MQKMPVTYEKCLGAYCGRTVDEFGNFSICGACPSGFRADLDSVCQKCVGRPTFYDWMYLSFMAVVCLSLHWFFIDLTYKRNNYRVLLLHVSALLESIIAAVCSLLVISPHGSLAVTSCPVTQLADWYTLFQNPSPDYVHVIYCTQEAVYPLYTLVFLYYAFSLACLLLCRPLISAKLTQDGGTKSIYAALYFLPILICVHAVLAGFIYYSYPFIVIVVSMVTNAVHFSHFHHQETGALLKAHVTSVRNVVVMLGHWLLHALSVIALTQLRRPVVHASLLALVPFPAIFYILTVKFTDPTALDRVS